MKKDFAKASKAMSWLAYGSLTASFMVASVGVGGTMLGDYIIANHLHGETMEQTKQICQDNLPNNSEAWKGCILEKRRGFESASAAHKKIRAGSLGTLALTVPLSVYGFRKRKKHQKNNAPS